jgi:hypothetical protein
MPHYKVRWEIDVTDAANPLEAAQRARAYQIKPGTTATCFDVFEAHPGTWAISAQSVAVDLGGPGEPGHVDGEPLPIDSATV